MITLAPMNLDFYKTGHGPQYPKGTNRVYSNFTPRSSRLAPVVREFYDDKVVVFGIQAWTIDYLIEEFTIGFFSLDKEQACKFYKRRMDNALGPDMVTTEHLEALHDLGYLPIEIKALPEGTRSDIKIPVFTIDNTIPEYFWLTNYLETVASCDLWKPMTTATIAYEYRRILEHYAELTGAPKEIVDIQAHDFSMRGMSGRHDAAMSGMGHLLSFVGTDTVPAICAAERYYGANSDEELVGCSVPATEHSVMCMGTKEDEIETFRRLIEDLYPTGIVSIVSDTWDFWKVITEYTVTLKDKIMARQPNALGLNKVVFRPDSGDPVRILTGLKCKSVRGLGDYEDVCEDYYMEDEIYEAIYAEDEDKYYSLQYMFYDDGCVDEVVEGDEIPECVVKGAVECLWDVFGGTLTEKDYKMLDEHVGLIYGDSITLQRANEILKRLEAKGFASTNVVFGVGSFTYQYITRDTFGFAMKATYGEVDGEGREIFKDPITDSGVKKSAKGLLRVEKSGDAYILHDQQTPEQAEQGELKVVFKDGELVNYQTFAEIRERLRAS